MLLPLILPGVLFWFQKGLPPHSDDRASGSVVMMFGPPLVIASIVLWARGVICLYRSHRLQPEASQGSWETVSYALAMLWVFMPVFFFYKVARFLA